VEACQREVLEETGLRVSVGSLIGIYSSPDWLVEYPDGARVQVVGCLFAATVESGVPGLSDETTEVGYFSKAECDALDLLDIHIQRIQDAFEPPMEPVIR
jgi:8-oxo-dGTP pyrophosphatase MutT (NUDIX family)